MFNIVDLNDIMNINLRVEWERLLNTSKLELFYLLNEELIKRQSTTFLLHVFYNYNMEIYKMKLINPVTLEFEINDKEKIFLNELVKIPMPKDATYLSSTFPHIFSLSLDSTYFDKEKNFYKRIFKKNEKFEALSNFIDGKIDNKLEYEKAIMLFSFIKITEKQRELNEILSKKKNLTIVIYPEDEVKQIDNVLYLLHNLSAEEVINSLIFRGKYLSKPEKKKPEEYIIYQLNDSNLIIPIKEINEYIEPRYKIKFEKMSASEFYRRLSKMK